MMQNKASSNHLKRFPYWLRQSVRVNSNTEDINRALGALNINTVCQSSQCPNIFDCFSNRRCTFLILGEVCTRSCRFCAIETGRELGQPDRIELYNIKKAIGQLDLNEVIITSVARDDLVDGGAGFFADCINLLRAPFSNLSIETLVPDFLGKKDSIEKLVLACPDIFSHNVETVPRLYKNVRPEASYKRSLDVLKYAKAFKPFLTTKSGLMVGLGEEKEEVYEVMKDLKDAGCDIVTIGQYLRPNKKCLEVERFLHPDEFLEFSEWAMELGFSDYSCSPFTRSSQK